MRKTLIFAGLTAGLAVAACATNPTTGVTTIGSINVADVQNDAVAICSYLPTAATVANIISANNPVVITADAVATAICQAVSPAKAAAHRRGAAAPLPYVYVPPGSVSGKFIH